MAVSKILYDGVGIDLTADTVDAAHLAKDYTAHDKNGNIITGIMTSGGGIPEPSPITAGDTPIYFTNEYIGAHGTSAETQNLYTIEKSGTYTIKCVFGATANTCTAQIRVNNTNQHSVSWSTIGSTGTAGYHELSDFDLTLSAGDIISVYLLSGSSTRGCWIQSFALCINWDNGF